MAKITIVGDAMVVESAYSLEAIKTLEKYRPKALQLFDESGKEIMFAVGSTEGKGAIGTYGANFGSETRNGTKKACITMEIPGHVTDAAKYAEEVIGVAIVNLNKVEAQFESALDDVDTQIEKIRECIIVA